MACRASLAAAEVEVGRLAAMFAPPPGSSAGKASEAGKQPATPEAAWATLLGVDLPEQGIGSLDVALVQNFQEAANRLRAQALAKRSEEQASAAKKPGSEHDEDVDVPPKGPAHDRKDGDARDRDRSPRRQNAEEHAAQLAAENAKHKKPGV